MTAVSTIVGTERGSAPRVHTCYDVLDVSPAGGVSDFTEGKYTGERNDRSAYLAAQRRQAEYLLDQAACGPGTRLLDVGCGYGRILEHAARRGAEAIGITVSPSQVAYCRARGLTAIELDYRDAVGYKHRDWEGSFDALIANGSLEHFVQPSDAAVGRTDAIFDEMFSIFRRLLPTGGRLVTTAIHFRRAGQVDPRDVHRGPFVHPRRSDLYHFAMVLERTFGGWYPAPGQLARCAEPYFQLLEQEDGTHDYHWTSEYWLKRLQWAMLTNPRVWWAVTRKWLQEPRAVFDMLRCQLWDQSWAWQFRPPAPTQLLRQTWLAI